MSLRIIKENKKIQAVVDELKKLPHVVLIRYMTYWMDDVDNGKYVVESDLPHEEWYADCKDYACWNVSHSYTART